MRELNISEIEEVGGGLTKLQNVGLGLGLAAFGFTVAAVVFAPVTIVAGSCWIFAAGAGALSGAAFATPTPAPSTTPP